MKPIVISITLMFTLSLTMVNGQKIGINTALPGSFFDVKQPNGVVLQDGENVMTVSYNGNNPNSPRALSVLCKPFTGYGDAAMFTGGNRAAQFFSGRIGIEINTVAVHDSGSKGIYNLLNANGQGIAIGCESRVSGGSDSYKAGVYSVVEGPATQNVAIFGSATGSDLNYAGYFSSGDVVVSNKLGIGQNLPEHDIDILDIQSVIKLTSDDSPNGSVLELRNTTASPSLLGAINFGTETATPGQISYHGDNAMTFRVNNSERMRINAAGLMGVGRTPVTNRLEVEGSASKSSAGDWLANSDARLKKNIQALDPRDAAEKLLSLRGISYEWNDDKTGTVRPEGIQYGFTAQNIQTVFPELVEEDANGYLQTAYSTYDAMIIETIRFLYEENRELRSMVEALVADRK